MEMRDDFILRIIELAGDFISSLIHGKKWDPKDIESISSEVIGLPYNTLLSMDGPTLAGILGINPDTYEIKVYLAAALFINEAQKQESLGNRNETELNYKKADFLLKKLDRIDGLTYAEDVRNLMEIVQKKLSFMRKASFS